MRDNKIYLVITLINIVSLLGSLGGCNSVTHNSLLALVLDNHDLVQVLPLGLLNVFKGVRISHREVLAQDLDVVNRFLQVVVDVLLHSQDCLVLVRKLQLLR